MKRQTERKEQQAYTGMKKLFKIALACMHAVLGKQNALSTIRLNLMPFRQFHTKSYGIVQK